MALLSSLKGLECLSTVFPSVETLGYFQETQALNRYPPLGSTMIHDCVFCVVSATSASSVVRKFWDRF